MRLYYTDTYALIEILRGNPNYRPYKFLATSEFNLLELAYALMRDYNKETALRILRKVRRSVIIVHPTDEDYLEAGAFRIAQRKKGRNFSLVDALGYVVAKKMGIPFLTGDKEFQGMENVEFVK